MGSQYISFFGQFASDLIEILNPIIVRENMPALCLKVIETMTVFDWLFPDSEKSFAFMQLLDVVHFLEIGGPIRSQWCLFGERALGQIGKTVNSGGVNYLKNLFYKHVTHEIQVSSIEDDDDDYRIDENDIYSMYLINHDTKNADANKIESSYDKDHDYKIARLDELIQSAIDFLLVQEIDDLIIESSLYRVYSTYLYFYKRQNEKLSFLQWLAQFYNNTENHHQYELKTHIHHEVYEIVDLSHKQGIIFKEDYEGIIKELFDLITAKNIEIYTKAIIKGKV
jgi:hypothetical protein